jgi:hypothetical protein
MAVAGEGVERNIGDHADLRHMLLQRPRRLVDQVVGGKAVGAGLVAQMHLDVGEGGDRRHAQVGGFLCRLDKAVDAHAADTGHRGDRLHDIGAGDDEDRPDQVVHRQPIFLHQAARPVRLAVAAHPPVAGDLIDDIGHGTVLACFSCS